MSHAPHAPAARLPRAQLESWRAPLAEGLAYLAPALGWGFLVGLLVGGLGGRLAMLLLRLTSDPALEGHETDDGFVIGAFTDETAFLLLATAAMGTLAGFVYALARPWLPRRFAPAIATAAATIVGGALIIRRDGIDFVLLEPITLAVAMFLAIPALAALLIALLTERSLRRPAARGRIVLGAALVALLLLPFGPASPLAALALFALLAAHRRGLLVPFWRTPAVAWLGRGAFAVLTTLAAVDLARDIATIL